MKPEKQIQDHWKIIAIPAVEATLLVTVLHVNYGALNFFYFALRLVDIL